MIGRLSHNWVYKEFPEHDGYFWRCSACGISAGDDEMTEKRCLKFNILVYWIRKIIQFRRNMFHNAGMFLLRFSR